MRQEVLGSFRQRPLCGWEGGGLWAVWGRMDGEMLEVPLPPRVSPWLPSPLGSHSDHPPLGSPPRSPGPARLCRASHWPGGAQPLIGMVKAVLSMLTYSHPGSWH